MVSDESILFDLEYRGIDSLLANISSGFEVPAIFCERVKKIIKKYYDIELVETPTGKSRSGHYCLMKHEDNPIMLLTKKWDPVN